MPAKSASATAAKTRRARADDATELLAADHREVKALFRKYQKRA